MKRVKVVSLLMFDAYLHHGATFYLDGKPLSPRFAERWTYRYISQLIKQNRLFVQSNI